MIRSSLLRGRNRAFGLGAVVAAAWLLFGASPASAQQGAITGTVTDASTAEPVSGAQVFVRGTNLGTLTGEDGSYRLTGVPTGQQTVRVRLIGYERASRTVRVAAGQATSVDFQLTQTALELQEVVVTGVAAETPQVKLPFTVESIQADELEVPSTNISGILQGKLPGVSIVSASGTPGGESDILLRGQTSINAAGRGQGPLIVIDGVIQSTGGSLADISSLDIESIEVVKGAAAASMYGSRAQNGVIQIETKSGADLRDAEENFDITTRAEFGSSDLEKQWPIAEFHVMRMNDSQTSFVDASGNEVEFSDALVTESDCGGGVPRCFQDNPYPVRHDNFNAFYDAGETVSLYGALAGATGETNLRVSGEYFNEKGSVVNNEGFDRVNGRVNVHHQVGEEFEISGTAFAARSTRDPVAGGGGQAGNAFFGFVFMSPGADIDQKRIGGQRSAEKCDGAPEDDCWFVVNPDPTVASDRDNPLFQEQSVLGPEEKKRLMGSGQATWTPVDWFSLEGTFSYDRTDTNNETFVRKGTPQGEGSGRSDGFMAKSDFFQEAINASVTANLNETFLDNELTARTQLRYLVEDQETNNFSANGDNFVTKGVRTLNALQDNEDFSISSQFTQIKAQNLLASGGLDYKDRYIVSGLIRRDGSSLFGPEERWQTYFRGSGAWRVAEEPWFNVGAIDQLKLRYSIGTAGSRPTFFQRFETFSIGGGGSLTFNTLGNKSLKPELSTEQEAGIDLTLFDRVQITGTYARAETEDQLLPVPLPGFFGFSEQWQNAGTLLSETWEGSIGGTFIQQQDVTWSATLTAHTTDETITELDVPSFKYGPGTQGGNIFFAREGEQLGTFYGFDYVRNCQDLNTTFGISNSACQANFDVNDHGYLVYVGDGNDFRDGAGPDGEVQTSDDLWGTTATVEGRTFEFGKPMNTERVDQLCLENNPDATEEECTTDFLPLGSSNPDFNVSFSNNFRWKGLTIYALLDAEVGFEIYNGTRQWANSPRIRGAGTSFSDQVGRPTGLKKPLAYYATWTYQGNARNDYFVEDGTYLKVRELSVSYSLPQSVLGAIPWAGTAFDAAQISVLGRNLLTFTDYSGYDPEVGFGNSTGSTGQTGSAVNTRFAAFQYPNFRTVSASLELTF